MSIDYTQIRTVKTLNIENLFRTTIFTNYDIKNNRYL